MTSIEEVVQKLVSDQEFDETLEKITFGMQAAASQKKAKGISPALLLYTCSAEASQERNVHQIQWDENDDELEVVAAIAQEAYNRKVEVAFIFMCCLCRMKKGHLAPGESLISKINQTTSEEECLVISGMTLDKRTNVAIVPIRRDKEGYLLLDSSEIQICGCQEEAIIQPFLLDKFITIFVELVVHNETLKPRKGG